MSMLQPELTKPQPPQPYTGPDYTGFAFTLKSSTNGNSYTLAIVSMTPENVENSAYITGTWGPFGSSMTNNFTGLITSDGEGIKCTWFNGATKSQPTVYEHQLTGGLTYYPRRFVNRGVAPATAVLQDGVVVVFDPNAPAGTVIPGMGPGNVSGSGMQPI
jgi:hypothetical protein